ncbi:MAG TPA: hypothetical protein VGG06_17070 [Thermoanaerobaculia bacterium]
MTVRSSSYSTTSLADPIPTPAASATVGRRRRPHQLERVARRVPMGLARNATIQAVEEAVINAMVAAETMVGVHGNRVHALPHEELREVLRRHGRLE